MGVATAVKPEARHGLLTEACDRNVAADLHFDGEAGARVTARVRLLRLEPELILTDRPQLMGKPVVFRPRQPVLVHFPLRGSRYAFRTQVARCHCPVRLNATQQVAGMALAMPSEVREQQRRSDFRLSLAGCETIQAEVHLGSPEGGGSAPIDALRFSARLINISGGGVSLLVDAQEAGKWRLGDTFFVSFCLPDVEGEFRMVVELRHERRIHERRSAVAGFKFLPWPLVPLKGLVRQILKFSAAQQRRQLKRAR
jgi:c-di-GMP-binding flagellar brake protein YcgR